MFDDPYMDNPFNTEIFLGVPLCEAWGLLILACAVVALSYFWFTREK